MASRPLQTVRDLRRSNRAVLLRRLYFHGPLARQDLINDTTLSPAAVSTVTAELIEDGLVVEAGTLGSDGGRPRVLLKIDPTARQVVGVDVGETRVRIELFDLDLTERARVEITLPPGRHDARSAVEAVREGLRVVTAQATGPLLGLGVGVPGVVDRGPEVLVHGQATGWAAVPLERLLAEVTDLPLFIDNGATAMGQAEMWFGAGRGARTAVVALLGSGVGAALVLDGAPYRGVGGSAGEWGHTVVRAGGRTCRCGARGCLEAYVGASAVIARYRELLGAGGSGPGEEEALRELLAAGRADSASTAKAREILDETAELLGAGIGNLVNLVNPELIVLGGWAGLLLGPELLPRIREAAGRYSLHHPFARARIELGALGPDAVARGAATLPVERFLETGGGG